MSAFASGDKPQPGDPFNPWRGACGQFVPELLGRQRKLIAYILSQDGTCHEEAREVTDGAKRLYERLVRFAGKDGHCFPSQQRLATELGKSDRQVRRDVASLESFKLIATKRGGRNHSNRYIFLWHCVFDGPVSADNRTFTSYQDAGNGPDDRTPVSTHDASCEKSDPHNRTSEVIRPDMDGRITGHTCPTNSVQEFYTGIQSSSSSEIQDRDDDEERPSLQQGTEPENPPHVVVVVGQQTTEHSPADIEDFRERLKNKIVGESRTVTAAMNFADTLLLPTESKVRQILSKAPGWNVREIWKALEINFAESPSRPRGYNWFLKTVADIYSRSNGIPPVLEEQKTQSGIWNHPPSYKITRNCDVCEDAGRVLGGGICPKNCNAAKRRQAMIQEQEELKAMADQLKRWIVHSRRVPGCELDLSPAGVQFGCGDLAEREAILEQLEQGVPLRELSVLDKYRESGAA